MKLLKSITIIISAFILTAFAQKEDQRIVSLGPSVTSQLQLLGAEDRIVGSTIYCNIDSTKKCEEIGSLLEINIEKIVELKPDIVFAVGLTPKKTIKKLGKLGINVVMIDDPANFTILCNNLRTIAEICDFEDKARTIIFKAELKLDSLRNVVEKLEKKTVLLQLGVNPVYATTKGTLGDQLIEFAGGKNAFNLEKSGTISSEEVVYQNPDVIVITDMGLSAEKEKKRWESFEDLKAAQNKSIYIIDSHSVCSPNVPLFVETVVYMSSLIHKNTKP